MEYPNAQCACGFLLHRDPSHFHSCKLISKEPRHKLVIDRLITCADRCGVVVVETEHRLASGDRTDITFQFPQYVKKIQVDVTIVNPTSSSYNSKSKSIPSPQLPEQKQKNLMSTKFKWKRKETCSFPWYGRQQEHLLLQ